MSISLYKPNKSNTGFAFSFSRGLDKKSQEPVLYIRAISQHSWDDSRRIGSFSANKDNPEKTINVKFNEFECGSILSSFRNRNTYDSFHKFESNQTVIKFTPWDKKSKINKLDPKTQEYKESFQIIPAFGISMIRNGNQAFKISLEPGEVECLCEFMKIILKDIYNTRIEKIQASIKSKPNDDAPPF
jgi:hypothetical protein